MTTLAKRIHTLSFPIFNKVEKVIVATNSSGKVTKVQHFDTKGDLTGLSAIVAVTQLEVDKLRDNWLKEASDVMGDSHQ